MKCPECKSEMRRVEVKVQGAKSPAISYQCQKCSHFEFEPASSMRVIEELRETPLKIKQKIVKLSQGRVGIYFNKDIIRSLDLKSGEDILVSVPDKKHILLEVGE
jgi:transposase-like protein